MARKLSHVPHVAEAGITIRHEAPSADVATASVKSCHTHNLTQNINMQDINNSIQLKQAYKQGDRIRINCGLNKGKLGKLIEPKEGRRSSWRLSMKSGRETWIYKTSEFDLAQ